MSCKIDDKKYLVKTCLGNYIERGDTRYSSDEIICEIPDGAEILFSDKYSMEEVLYFVKKNGEKYDEFYIKGFSPSHTWISGTIREIHDGMGDIVWERKCLCSKPKRGFNKFLGETSSSTPLKGYSESKPDLQYTPFNPLDVQEGGGHYKGRGIQPVEYTQANSLNFQQGNVVKYITRHKEKNGVEDLAKVVHYALLEAYFVYGVEGSSELKDRILKMLGES